MTRPDDIPEWAWSEAASLRGAINWQSNASNEAIARALLSAERRGLAGLLSYASRLEEAVSLAEEAAGTLPAKFSVKLYPKDWHRVADLSRSIAAATRQLGASE